MDSDCMTLSVLLVILGIHLSSSMELHRRKCEDASEKLCSSKLQAFHCYSSHNRAICCHSCELRRDQNNEACPFGDRDTVIKKESEKYTCSEYINTFGTAKCHESFEFMSQCCKSCNWRGL